MATLIIAKSDQSQHSSLKKKNASFGLRSGPQTPSAGTILRGRRIGLGEIACLLNQLDDRGQDRAGVHRWKHREVFEIGHRLDRVDALQGVTGEAGVEDEGRQGRDADTADGHAEKRKEIADRDDPCRREPGGA